jgi:hypothetical protein
MFKMARKESDESSEGKSRESSEERWWGEQRGKKVVGSTESGANIG